MEEIIRKAIQGGYGQDRCTSKKFKYHIDSKTLTIKYEDAEWDGTTKWSVNKSIYEVLSTLAFWTALCKACGWTNQICTICGTPNVDRFSCQCGESYPPTEETWLYYALRFHEINLTEGWDKAVDYLTEITK